MQPIIILSKIDIIPIDIIQLHFYTSTLRWIFNLCPQPKHSVPLKHFASCSRIMVKAEKYHRNSLVKVLEIKTTLDGINSVGKL